jgi:hypothetical protein
MKQLACCAALVVWCSLSCSDPVAPPAQGAFSASVTAASPQPAGKMCPSGAAQSFEAPTVTEPKDKLSTSTYAEKLIDGENGAEMSCTVKGKDTFSFDARIDYRNRTLELTGGVVNPNLEGTARVVVFDQTKLSTPLTSGAGECTIRVVTNSNGPQIRAGSMWASFDCPGVQAAPSDYCRANGVFVLENCNQ